MNVIIDSGVINDLIRANTSTFTGLLPILTIMISVPIAFYVLRKIILLFPRK